MRAEVMHSQRDLDGPDLSEQSQLFQVLDENLACSHRPYSM
jgi:hypothetical protein